MKNNKPVVMLNWQLSDLHGWGIAAIETFSYFALSGKYQPVMAYEITDNATRSIDNFRKRLLIPSFKLSNQLSEQVHAASNGKRSEKLNIDLPVIHSLGNNLASSGYNLQGTVNIGRLVFEIDKFIDFDLSVDRFDCFVVASNWNKNLLEKITNKPIFVVNEGIDTSVFYPSSKSGVFNDDDFLIFTGGKIEYRKGQDLVLEVFRRFSSNKPNVKLVTAWQSVFSKNLSDSFKGILKFGLQVDDDGIADVKQWAEDNGIMRDKIIDLGQVPHNMIPNVMREMDCAMQLSRAEGGTNFVAMEAMACGLPTLLSRSTGHYDIMNYPNAVPVNVIDKKIDSEILGIDDWREVDIDDAVNKLEYLYESKMSGVNVRNSEIFPRSWVAHSKELETILCDLS